MDNIVIMDKLDEMEKNINSYQSALDSNINNIKNNIQNIPNLVTSEIADNTTFLISRVTNTANDSIWFQHSEDNYRNASFIFFMPFKGTYKIHIDSTNNYTSSNSSYLEIYNLNDTNTVLHKFQLTSYKDGKSNLSFIYNISNEGTYKFVITAYGVYSNLTISSNIYPTNDYSLLFHSNK